MDYHPFQQTETPSQTVPQATAPTVPQCTNFSTSEAPTTAPDEAIRPRSCWIIENEQEQT